MTTRDAAQHPGSAAPRVRSKPRAVSFALALSLVLHLSACGGSEGAATAEGDGSADLDGRTFRSTQARGHTLVEGSVVMLTFEDGRIAASAECNTMTGAATWDGGILSVAGDLATTMMGCDPELQAQDEWLASFLTSGPALTLVGTTLTLGDEGTGLTLEERLDLPLQETEWTLDGLIANDAVSSLPASVGAAVTIDADGARIAVSAGCNTGSASVTVTPASDPSTGSITVDDLATTRMLCPDEVMAVEAQVLAVLQGSVDYSIDGTTLTLTNGEQGLVFTAPAED